MPKVLNFGSLNLDYVYRVNHFVQPGETLNTISQTVNAGGKGLNQSIALARAGADVYHAGCLGTGGELLKKTLIDNGVNICYLYSVNVPQGNAIIQVSGNGENCILLFSGSNECVTEKQISETIAGFGEGDYLVLQNEINLLPVIVDRAYDRGMKIILNPSPYDSSLDAVDFQKLTWLIVNEIEAAQITGSSEPKSAWNSIQNRYPELSLLITLGSRGSMVFHRDNGNVEVIRQEAFPASAIDTTGAGDTFTGYFVASLIEQKPLSECMQEASMAASISTTQMGAAQSIPYNHEVEEALALR